MQAAGAVLGPPEGGGQPCSGGPSFRHSHRPAHTLHQLWQPICCSGACVFHCVCYTSLLPGILEKLVSKCSIWQDTSCCLSLSCMSRCKVHQTVSSSPICCLDFISCHCTAAASIHAAVALLPTMLLLPMLLLTHYSCYAVASVTVPHQPVTVHAV